MSSTKLKKRGNDFKRFDLIQRLTKDVSITEDCLRRVSPIPIPSDPWEQASLMFKKLYSDDAILQFIKGGLNSDGRIAPIGSSAIWTPAVVEELIADEDLDKSFSGYGGYYRINPLQDRFKDQNRSDVTDHDVDSFLYTVIEHDELDLATQLNLLTQLPLRTVSIVYSAGKSYHALVRVGARCLSEYTYEVGMMYHELEKLGFDPSNKNPSRLSRFPGPTREQRGGNLNAQRLVYLNPQADFQPISKLL